MLTEGVTDTVARTVGPVTAPTAVVETSGFAATVAVDDPPPPRFSLVIPAYNEEDYLTDCLASLAQQDFPGSVEIIVVDNNSSDMTSSIARAAGATVIFEPRQGVCAARQTGTAVATGEIIVSTDADTRFRPDWLSRIDRAFREQQDLTAIAGPPHWVDAPRWGRVYERVFFGVIDAFYRATGRVTYVSAANIAFRRSAWAGYDVHLTQGGDELDLLRQLHKRGKVGYDRYNVVLTSARRMDRGLLYNVFVTCFYYYLLGYSLNRLLGRTTIGMAPACRPSADRAAQRRRMTESDARVARLAYGWRCASAVILIAAAWLALTILI